MGIAVLLRSLIQDVVVSRRRPYLDFGDVYVRKFIPRKEYGGEIREVLYLQEVKNTTKNSQAENCRCSLDLTSIEMSPFYGVWEVSDNEVIPIGSSELVKLFSKNEFTRGAEIKEDVVFYVRTTNGIRKNPKLMDTQLMERQVKMSIQSSNADFSGSRMRTVKQIMDSAKQI